VVVFVGHEQKKAKKKKKKKKKKRFSSKREAMDHNAAPADNANDGKVAVFDPNTEQFSVYPKTDCPHLAAHLNSDANPELIEEAFLKHNSCNSCQNPSENWICLTCHGYAIYSKYVVDLCDGFFVCFSNMRN
jgi:hypothetical protein